MSNKKQTAVDLLYQRAIFALPMGAIDARLKIEETYHEAKAMEKEENRDSFYNGFHKGYNVGQNDIQSHPLALTIANHIHSDYEQYYTETYGE
jgi:hypothetical protein